MYLVLDEDGKQAVTICVLPLYHIYAMNVTMTPVLASGNKLVFIPRFDPNDFLSALIKHKPTFLHLAPPLVSFLATNPAVKSEHLSSLHHVAVAAAPSGPELIKKFKSKAPNIIYREGKII